MRRIHPDFIQSGHIITRSYSGVVVKSGGRAPQYGWELEDRLTGHVLSVSSRDYTSPRGAATALYRVAQATQNTRDLRDLRDALDTRGGEE